MYKILEKKNIAPSIFLMKIEAPRVAKSAKPGQFVIVKMDEKEKEYLLLYVIMIKKRVV